MRSEMIDSAIVEHNSVNACVEAWQRCFHLCYNHQRERTTMALSIISERMIGGKQWEKAERVAGN
eukprot:gene39321-18531_t